MYDIVVIGGGASGMLASAVAAQKGARVLLLERNEKLGRKLNITGKGRCNLTNDSSVSEVLDNINSGRDFLQSAINGFTPKDCIEFFESLGVKLKTERGKRVFPESDKASEIVDALKSNAQNSGVEIKKGRANGVFASEEHINYVSSTIGQYQCEAVILATGGLSYPATGSTGDGYTFASSLGHTVTPLRASLVPIVADENICAKMQGLSLRNIGFSIYDDSNKLIFKDFGELLFTHYGMSGPLALSASAHLGNFDEVTYRAYVDFKPALSEQTLDQRLLRDFQKNANRDFVNALGDLLSRLSIIPIIEKSEILPRTKVNSITREQRLSFVQLLKAFPIDIQGTRPIEEAVITSGGIDLKEINPKTMESKIIKGLYFAGEIIDADAYTGGYNLQIAWSTAYAAGTAAASSLNKHKGED
ncbi:MAG: NAD(P)/FAD-dependent oxidoreductase [Oscillospiraceae bacterium]|nr:NAD(P)/FAD-dependent oxidoreductase [Oscillospiraceae bacterium]